MYVVDSELLALEYTAVFGRELGVSFKLSLVEDLL